MHQASIVIIQREVVIMENFWTLLGFGFALLCLAVVIAIAGILGYIVHIAIAKNKKIEVTPAKADSNQSNTHE